MNIVPCLQIIQSVAQYLISFSEISITEVFSMSKSQQDITEILAQVAKAVVGKLSMEDLLNEILKIIMTILDAEVCSIFLKDQDSPNEIVCVAGAGYAKHLVGKARYKIGEGFTGSIVKSGEPRKIDSPDQMIGLVKQGKIQWSKTHDSIQWQEYNGQTQFRNLMALPLKTESETFGVIKVENKLGADSFSDEDFKLFNAISNIVITLTLQNARLYKQNEILLKTLSTKVAHKINNQIARYDFIRMALHSEIQSWFPSKKQLRHLEERIAEATGDIKRLINDFKNLLMEMQLECEDADLNDVIREEANAVERTTEVKIETTLSTDLPRFSFDKARLSESIREMLGNSVKSHAKNIWITTEYRHEDNQKTAVITIQDDGEGISHEFEKKLFIAFHSTRPEGTGLGLSTVKETVEKHGGRIEFKPSEKGARFEITLPIVPKNL